MKPFLLSLLFSGTLMLSAEQAQIFEPKDYSHLKGMEGFSDEALDLHFTLYKGYVTNVNLLQKLLNDSSGPAFSELRRRFGWEFDGMRFHELYFENLGGKTPLSSTAPLYKAISQEFGSFDKWKEDFIKSGMIRGIGWVVLYYDKATGHLFNTWINEHDLGNLTGATPLLVMDLFEHAYLPDYLLNRRDYIDAFFKNIDWQQVETRFSNLQ